MDKLPLARHSAILPYLLHQLRRRLSRPFAFGIFGAAQEIAATALAELHRGAALRTGLTHLHGRRRLLLNRRHYGVNLLLEFRRDGFRATAARISAATEE